MRRWAFMLGGLIVWAIHFLGVYVIASVADVTSYAAHPASRLTVGAFTVVCLIIAGGLTLDAARRRQRGDEMARFAAAVAAAGGAVATISILWQGLPALTGY